jgi:hypothetical protein
VSFLSEELFSLLSREVFSVRPKELFSARPEELFSFWLEELFSVRPVELFSVLSAELLAFPPSSSQPGPEEGTMLTFEINPQTLEAHSSIEDALISSFLHKEVLT